MGYANFKHGAPLMLDYTPGSAVNAGDIVIVNDTARIAHKDIAASTLGALAAFGGVYDVVKATSGGSAMADGKVAYWDTNALVVVTTPNANTKPLGVTVGASVDADTTQRVMHMPTKALTDSGGGTAGTTIPAGAGIQVFTIPVNLASLANSQVYNLDPGFNGSILSVDFRTTVIASTAAKAATLTGHANGAAVTGGAVALTTAGCATVGAKVAGSAVTAGNTFTNAQAIGVSVSGVTTFAEGAGVIEITVRNNDLANALSSLNSF